MRGVASQLDDRAEGHTWSRWSVDSEQLVGAVGDRALKSGVGEWRHESFGVRTRKASWRRAGEATEVTLGAA